MVVEFLISLINTLGYFGVFLSSLIGNASIILPVPSVILIFVSGKFLNPLLVGIIGGLGGSIGELTAYFLGAGGSYLIKKGKQKKSRKKNKNRAEIRKFRKENSDWFRRANIWFSKRNGFLIVFLFSVLPLPHDVIGIICGAIKYDIKKFFVATLLGKTILYIVIAYAGFYGLSFFANNFL